MARSLSDNPVKLERELSGLRVRAQAIETKLLNMRRAEDSADVATGEKLHKLAEVAKAAIVCRRPGERLEIPDLPDDVEPDEWGEF